MATGTLTPLPLLKAVDATNTPVASATMFWFLAGTSTAAPVYQDVGLTTAFSQGAAADGNGNFAEIFLTPGQAYKLDVRDPTGITSLAGYPRDNISAVPTGTTNLTVTGTAGQSLGAAKAVFLSDGSGGNNAGQWYLADPAQLYSSLGVPLGITVAAIVSGASGAICVGGQASGLTGLSIGSIYYVSTAGALTTSAPTNPRIVGYADTTTTLVMTANPMVPVPSNSINDFRLSLTTALPVTTADVTGASAVTVFCTPMLGNRIDLYNSSGAPQRYLSAEVSVGVPAALNQMYDIFGLVSAAGVFSIELLAWTNDTTRATALARTTTGALTKSGDLTRRYLGSVRSTGVAHQSEDSILNRFLWNYYNRVSRQLQRFESTTSWTYSTATVRQANGSTSNQVNVVVGIKEALLDLSLSINVANSGGGVNVSGGIGENSTTSYAAGFYNETLLTATGIDQCTTRLVLYPAVGFNFYSWNEWSAATPTTTWYAAVAAVGSTITAGLTGSIPG